MLEYLPWSNQELSKSLSLYKDNVFSILDIELGGACNLSCIYCDTPDRKIISKISTEIVEKLFQSNQIRWLFICGLGEPTVKPNFSQLIDLLSLCKKYDIRCSMFTNLLNLNDEIRKFIIDGILYILFKLDSFNENKIQDLFNTNQTNKILSNIDDVKSLVTSDGNFTNIAASIVPTSINQDEIIDIVKFCIANNIFPLIGDLENSGITQDTFKYLKINNDELLLIKQRINELFNVSYRVPVCPSVIGGIHISHGNQLIVDHYTGLSCHWFWLKQPKIKVLADINNATTYDEIASMIINYRSTKIDFIENYISDISELPFGGCGGDIKYMLTGYLTICKQE